MTNRILWIREIARAALRANLTADDLTRALSPEDRVAVQAEIDRLNDEQRQTGDPPPAAASRGEEQAVRHTQAPGTDPTASPRAASSVEQRSGWRQRAVWLARLGLSPVEAPVEIIEEVANAALILLDENERLRADLVAQNESLLRVLFSDLLEGPDAPVGQATSSTGPVARERDGRLCVITGVPYTLGTRGSRHYDPAVAERLDLALREMLGSGSSVSIRGWADLADPPAAAHTPTTPPVGVAHPDRLRFIPSDLLDRAVADAAIAHDTAAHAAEHAFANYVDAPTPRLAELTEHSIASLRYEWEVLLAVVRRLLDVQEVDRRIGRWLYANVDAGTLITLGDVSEWPWLLDEEDS